MNWRQELNELLWKHNDPLVTLVIQYDPALEDGDLYGVSEPTSVDINHPTFAREFDESFDVVEGCRFTAWGEKYVYFPASYDGREWIAFVPRHPAMVATEHVGGG
jgi:hypothetical protein